MLKFASSRLALVSLLVAGTMTAGDAALSVTAQDEVGGGTACVDGFRVVPLPQSASKSRPYKVLVEDGRLAWVVGGADGEPLILRRGTRGWKQVDASGGGLEADAPVGLLDASIAPDGALWGAGYVRPARGVMERYVGRTTGLDWEPQDVDLPPADRDAFAGIATKGRGRAWVVGTRLAKGRTRAAALRWDGRRWIRRDPVVKARESGLTAVARAPGGNVWAVGWATVATGQERPLILKSGRDGWVNAAASSLPAGSAAFTDVTFDASGKGWATGYLVPEGASRYRPLVAQQDGAAWVVTQIPWPDDVSGIPRSIAVSADGGIWLAGTMLRPGSSDSSGFVAQSEDGAGADWQIHDALPLVEPGSELFSVAATATGAVVSGVDAMGRQAVLLETCAEPLAPSVDVAVSAVSAQTGVVSARLMPTGASAPGAAPTYSFAAGERRLPPPVDPQGFSIRDVSREAGLDLKMHTLAGLAVDLNVDGWDDLFIWSHGNEPRFLLGGPDGFQPGPADAFGKVDRHQCSVADVDADGRLDVFCAVGRARGSAIDRHELSLAPAYPDGGVSPGLLGIEDPFGRGRATTFIQLDGDGLPDLFISNSPDRGDALPGTNRFFRNVGGRFVAAPEVGLDVSTGGWCALAADIDSDGDEDLLHCQEYSDDARDAGLRVHQNDDGKLTERSRELGIEPIDDIDAAVADMTGDGRPDIVQLSRKRLRISQGSADGTFTPVYEVLTPFATGMAVGDVDGDGAMDIYVVAGSTRGNETDLLLVNDGRGHSFTSVKVPQTQRGSGADVLALDFDRNGLTDFAVLDGRGAKLGPVRLLASYPAS